MTHIAYYIGMMIASERELAQALIALGQRHSQESDIAATGEILAQWSNAHVEALEPFARRYGSSAAGDLPDRIRAEIFHGARIGGFGLLLDLQEAVLLTAHVHTSWTALQGAANALDDRDLDRLCVRCAEEAWRQQAWLRARIKMGSGQALVVPPERVAALKASIPGTQTPAAMLDAVWTPLAAATLIAAVGGAALLAGQPWLLPSLGPSAYMQAELSSHPASRAWNTVVGHAVALGAGFLAVLLVGAASDPAMLSADHLSGARMAAAVIAIALTALSLMPLRASHPPAAATALLVALGSLSSLSDASHLMAGALVLACVGEAARRMRIGRRPSRSAVPAPVFGKEPPETVPRLRPSAAPG